MKKSKILSIVAIVVIAMTVALTAVACSSGSDKGVSGRSIFETPTPSIFDEPRTQTPAPVGRTSTPMPATQPPSTPAPTTPPPAPPSPVPSTPTPVPGPQFFSLNLKITNSELGEISVEPKAPENRYEKDTSLVLYATPKTGAKFNGWSGDAKEPSNSLSLTMNSNKNIQAEFAKITFPLNVNASPGGSISLSPSSPAFDYGASVSARAVPDKGYSLKWWTGDASGTQNPVTITMDREKRIGAEFVKAEYLLSTKVVPSGFIDLSTPGSRFDGGTVLTLTARPADRHRFISWSGDVSGTDPTVTLTMDSDKTVTANFAKIVTLTIFIIPVGGGTVTTSSPSIIGSYDRWSGDLDAGSNVTLTANPNSGYEFEGWAGQVTSGNQTISVDIHRDMNITAAFRRFGQN